jgi:hypothetical protein
MLILDFGLLSGAENFLLATLASDTLAIGYPKPEQRP